MWDAGIFRTVAAVGDPAPGGGTFDSFISASRLAPALNDSGDVVFSASVAGVPGLFLSRGGSLTVVALTGQATPLGGTYNGFPGFPVGPSLSNSGEVAFMAFISGGAAESAIFRWRQGVATKVVAPGDSSPLGTPFVGLGELVLNNTGALAFLATVGGGGGIFVEHQGGVRAAVTTSDTPPGGGSWIGFVRVDLNDRGDIVFSAAGFFGGARTNGLFFARPQADLAITKTDSPDPVAVGTTLTYTVVVTNNGPDVALGVTLTDTLPGSVTLLSATPSQGTCGSASPITCDLGTLLDGASATVTILVRPTATGDIANTVIATSGAADPVPSNNTATVLTTVRGGGSPTSPVGGTVTGVHAVRVVCQNLSRGRGGPDTITLAPNTRSWDCQAAGLVVNSGDHIKMTVTATAD